MIRQRLTITSGQMAAILGLERFLSAHGLILVCPQCVQDGQPHLDTQNTTDAPEWKIDCACRERRSPNVAVRAMDADGTLLASADQILAPIRLAVRCATWRCVRHPIEIDHTPTTTILRCRCAKTTLHPPTPIVH